MTLNLTLKAVQVFDPVDGSGNPRGADMGESQTWGTEIEGSIVGLIDQVREDLENLSIQIGTGVNFVTAYSSIDDGLDDVSNGVYFSVGQDPGIGFDYYYKSGSDGIFVGASPFFDLSSAANLQSPMPAGLLTGFYANDMAANGERRGVPLGPGLIKASRNIYSQPHFASGISNASATVTRGAADGPNHTLTATRVNFSSLSGAFRFYISTFDPQDGDYCIRFKVKLNSGTSPQTIRHGDASEGLTDVAVNDSTWTTIEAEFTKSGGAFDTYAINSSTSVMSDLLVDEIQIASGDLASLPDYVDEARQDGYVFQLGFPIATGDRVTNGLIDNTYSDARGAGVLRLPSYPSATALTEFTLVFVVNQETDPASGIMPLLQTEKDDALSTDANTFYVRGHNSDYMQTPFNVTAVDRGDGLFRFAGGGTHVLSLRVKDGAQEMWVDGVPYNNTSDAFSGFSARQFEMLASRGTAGTVYSATSRFDGKLGAAMMFDRYLDDDAMTEAFKAVRARLAADGTQLDFSNKIIIASGDSTSAVLTGGNGPTFAWLMADAGRFGGNTHAVFNNSISGETIDDVVESRLAEHLRCIERALAVGCVPVVMCYLGTNDFAEMISDPSGLWDRYRSTLLDVYEAAGAKLVMGTQLPHGNLTEPAFNAWLALQYASDYSLMDFAGDPDIGNWGDHLNTTYYNGDQIHPNSLNNETKMAPISQAAIEAVT